MSNFLQGYRTYAAAGGLVLLGLVELSDGNSAKALEYFLQALGLFGLRRALETYKQQQ